MLTSKLTYNHADQQQSHLQLQGAARLACAAVVVLAAVLRHAEQVLSCWI